LTALGPGDSVPLAWGSGGLLWRVHRSSTPPPAEYSPRRRRARHDRRKPVQWSRRLRRRWDRRCLLLGTGDGTFQTPV